MTKLALSVAAMLLASSSAFAGSAHLPGRRAEPAAAATPPRSDSQRWFGTVRGRR
ncbi:hypothetical protein [Mesorhizobium sp. B2-4-12]|uniref:hypothetical protein n=1 Tax=Mesorhizobium sp. B2-4-12 TaxID=2589937 RepID=UPI0015E37844|nr:hypothetical protein [Mesorhizobium sp. B2-4-12]